MGFAEDTAVEDRGDGRFAARIVQGWDIGGNANGGYVMAIAARAITAATGMPDPLTTTAHYLAPGRVGPLDVEVQVLRAGRRHATASARVRQGDRDLLALLATTTDLVQADGPQRLDAAPPEVPGPDECVPMTGPPGEAPSFASKVDLRLHPDDAGFFQGRRSGRAEVRGWFRLPEEAMDTVGLLVALDGFPPTIFNVDLPVGWTPTVELTAHVRDRPDPEWQRCAFRTRFVSGGYLEEDGEIWNDEGHLIAQSRQLALVPRPSPL